ncbi:hypothetical protein HYDPIDRAFT_28693 [Hydnomerulius pinastri MD-312]|uniref:Uncharacterized protein n=1 Tax=Hydnomerulius pinastri MD-312 TaxID=994086 RepID=A0A0C9WFK4_9AGAM|nr:hypothetical protein HYDPIDRAFT_28693 [Hydnomerulius pinastri MD-312]
MQSHSHPLASLSQLVEWTTHFPYRESPGGARLRNRRVYALNSSLWLVLTVIISWPQTSFLDLPAVTTSGPTDDDPQRQQSIVGFDRDHTLFDVSIAHAFVISMACDSLRITRFGFLLESILSPAV